jgi:hypothetical protein
MRNVKNVGRWQDNNFQINYLKVGSKATAAAVDNAQLFNFTLIFHAHDFFLLIYSSLTFGMHEMMRV